MSKSSNAPRLGLRFSEEQKTALQRANKLKQELYAQQKRIQFSNLLERSGQDIESYVESQKNIFISVGSSKDSDLDANDAPGQPLSNVETSAVASTPQLDNVDAVDDSDGVDFFLSNAFFSKNTERFGRVGLSDDAFSYEPTAVTTESLRDHLVSQLRLDGKYSKVDPKLKEMCFKIIGELDPSGYLKPIYKPAPAPAPPPGAIAYPEEDEETLLAIEEFDQAFDIDSTRDQRFRAKNALDAYFSNQSSSETRALARADFDSIVGRQTSRQERESTKKTLDVIETEVQEIDPLLKLFAPEDQTQALEALKVVQSLDPPGVGARDLREALLLRLRPDAEYEASLRRLITNYFDDFINKRLGALSKKSGISQNELMKIYGAPFPFYPSPSELFTNDVTPTRVIYPEIIVEEDKTGRWRARLDESLANVELDPYYRRMLFSKRVDRKTRKYLRRQYVEAQALMDALRNRNLTLLRVGRAVVDFQQEYFSDSESSPKPLTQQQIADKLGLDTSTVSRACSDKWLSTPRGYASFKDLFPKAVAGEATSAHVADMIRILIGQEKLDAPLSDEKIAAQLKKQFGIKVSRKTVQEHRDRLLIPNSRVRKRMNAQKKE
ncbi:MAG: hypothetical protein ACOX0A_04705 [Thermoguttaceae bacterium]|jgi:RNA polymerase sigma-54 factor